MPQMVPHGTLDYEELARWGYSPQELIVFSSNINPYGPPPSVVQVVADNIEPQTLSSYPDRLSRDLRQALSEHHGLSPEAILVGNGTADILWLLAVLFLRHRRVAILSPTFGEYANAAHLVGVDAQLVSIPGWHQLADGTFQPGDTILADTLSALTELAPDVVFVCNPNSPTGEHWSRDVMLTLLDALPDALWIVDEAYAAFTPEPWSTTPWCRERNLIVLHSMTKDFALGGLRLGYAAAQPDLIRKMADAQPPWNVNALAQVAGKACMQELDWRTQTMAVLREEMESLREGLKRIGYAPRATSTNYVLVPVADPTKLRRSLLQRRIVVRDCTSFGLPSFIRIDTQRPEHNRLLLDAMSELSESHGV